jgi:putative effector of murein hydrolase
MIKVFVVLLVIALVTLEVALRHYKQQSFIKPLLKFILSNVYIALIVGFVIGFVLGWIW